MSLRITLIKNTQSLRSADKYLGDLATDIDFNQNRKVRIYREDVYKIISEGENIKIPPIQMF